ncbi:MAG: alpha/beta hydrolase [bacterium]
MKSTDLLNFILPSNGYHLTEYAYGDGARQKVDVYLPVKKSVPYKIPVVFVYGGAWKKGSKGDFEFVAHALTGLGHPVIIPDYRLFPTVHFPDFVEDVAGAIAYIDAHGQQILGETSNRYILMGHSAGAHTAALLATDKSYLQKHSLYAKLKALIALSGPYDLPLDDPEVEPIFVGATAQQAKPIKNVHGDMPATLLLHGLDDKRVLPMHTERFAATLEKAGVPAESHLYGDVGHVDIIAGLAAPLRWLSDSYKDIAAFLAQIETANENRVTTSTGG